MGVYCRTSGCWSSAREYGVVGTDDMSYMFMLCRCSLRVRTDRAAPAAAALPLVVPLGMTLLIYTVLNTPSGSDSGIQSGAPSGKRSNGSWTHFSSVNASRCGG